MTDYRELRTRSENHRCAWCDLGDEMVVEIERLKACRAELEYIVVYFEGGIMPLDLRDWLRRAYAALEPKQ